MKFEAVKGVVYPKGKAELDGVEGNVYLLAAIIISDEELDLPDETVIVDFNIEKSSCQPGTIGS